MASSACFAALRYFGERHGMADQPRESASGPQQAAKSGRRRRRRRGRSRNRTAVPQASPPANYGALDLGTNNCRLLVAAPTDDSFRVVDAFSRIVRLGEGLSRTGELSPAAQDRAIAALKICAAKLDSRKVTRRRLIATEACRGARNGLPRCAQWRGISGARPPRDRPATRDRQSRNGGEARRQFLCAAA